MPRPRPLPACPPTSFLALLAAVCLVLVSTAEPARADEAVVVLDRGRAAAVDAEAYTRNALRLVEALRARKVTASLVLYGTRADGRIRASQLGDDLEEALARAARREGYQFEAPTDPRHALEIALRKVEDPGPLLVFLVGPFDRAPGPAAAEEPGAGDENGADPDADGKAEDDDPESEAAVEALTTWEEEAPAPVRVFAFDLSTRRRTLIAGARGVLAKGTVVLGADTPVATVFPYSPVGRSDLGAHPDLRANVTVELESLVVGARAVGPLLLSRSSDGLGKISSGGSNDGVDVEFAVARPWAAKGDAPKVETLAFEVPDDPSVLWLVDPPQPRTIQWTELAPDARISSFRTHDGEDAIQTGTHPAPFEAMGVHVGEPVVRRYQVEFSRVGDVPEWRVEPEDGEIGEGETGSGELPEGMSVRVGDVVNRWDDVASVDITITYAAQRGLPLSAEGVLLVTSAGHPKQFRIPYRVEVPTGRVVARLEAPEAARRLPAAEDAAPWILLVEEVNPNAPALVRIEATLEPPSLARRLTARLTSGGGVEVTWDLAQRLDVRPGRRYELHVDLAPGERSANGALALRLPEQRGVQGTSTGRGSLVGRSPRLVVAEGGASYAMDGGEVVGSPPLLLEVDPDGGTGDWRLALHAATPTVETAPGAPVRFGVRPQGPGRWALVPEGAWEGARGDTFSDRTETVPVKVAWSMGAAPGILDVKVEVRPRWGKAGWILAVLAALALALGLWGMTLLKAAPVAGTLLYTVEGRQAAVGRLDLAPVGRKVTPVAADASGRLGLGHGGPGGHGPGGRGETVLVIRPTRVGGFLEIPPPTGPERHLLVDGLTVAAGRHRIRYVSGRPEDATVPTVSGPGEELLGPEFDMPTGRIDALGRDAGTRDDTP